LRGSLIVQVRAMDFFNHRLNRMKHGFFAAQFTGVFLCGAARDCYHTVASCFGITRNFHRAMTDSFRAAGSFHGAATTSLHAGTSFHRVMKSVHHTET